MKKVLAYILKHKLVALIVILVLGGGGYYGYQKWFAPTVPIKYVTAKVEKGVLISSISGTGQISSENQVDLKTKASGDVTYVGVQVGKEVKAGTLLLSLNARDALKTVRDAESSLRSAQISYEKLVAPSDALTILQSEHALTQAQETKAQAEDNLNKAYEDGFNSVTNAFLELPGVISGLGDSINGNDYASYQANIDWYVNQASSYDEASALKVADYKSDAVNSYSLARQSYDKNFIDYKNTSRNSVTSTILALILQTYETTRLVADAVKNMNNLVDFTQDTMEKKAERTAIPAAMSTQQSTLDTYTSKTNTLLTNLLSVKNTVDNYKSTIESAIRSIEEKSISLADLKAGATALDIESQKLSLQKSENALIDAKEKLSDYSVRAPFDGIIAAFTAKKGDSLSSGATIGTIITKQRVATISLNEVDAAKVKVGQKVNLSFDAIEDLNITGEVAEVDTLGTVSQGVVSYNVKIIFDLQDDRVKSGMTVTASITISTKQDVLMVKTSAIKTQGEQSYVEILIDGILQKKNVVIDGSNDTMTEIVSGLEEGEEVVTQSISTAKTTAGNSSSGENSFRMGGPGM